MQLREKADSYYYSEHYPEALELFVKAMEVAVKEHDMLNYIACTGYIGNVYDAFGDNNSSSFYYLKGYEAAKKVGNRTLQSIFLTNLVTSYTRAGNVKKTNTIIGF